MNKLTATIIATLLTGYNILLFATKPSLFLWCIALVPVCVLFWMLTFVTEDEDGVKVK